MRTPLVTRLRNCLEAMPEKVGAAVSQVWSGLVCLWSYCLAWSGGVSAYSIPDMGCC
jgi:hypothetical protein